MLGAMLLFKGKICQIRGGSAAAQKLMGALTDGLHEAVVPLGCGDLIEARFPVRRSEKILLMCLKKGSERLYEGSEPDRLSVKDVEDIVALMRMADPATWGDVTIDGIRGLVAMGVWYGIHRDGRLIAVAGSWFKGEAKVVNIVAVDEHQRGKGLGRIVLSRLLRDIFEVSDTALIHVRSDNGPALSAYRSVGYLPHAEYQRIVIAD